MKNSMLTDNIYYIGVDDKDIDLFRMCSFAHEKRC